MCDSEWMFRTVDEWRARGPDARHLNGVYDFRSPLNDPAIRLAQSLRPGAFGSSHPHNPSARSRGFRWPNHIHASPSAIDAQALPFRSAAVSRLYANSKRVSRFFIA